MLGSFLIFGSTVTPDAGYRVKTVTANGAVLTADADGKYTLTDLQADTILKVEFEKIGTGEGGEGGNGGTDEGDKPSDKPDNKPDDKPDHDSDDSGSDSTQVAASPRTGDAARPILLTTVLIVAAAVFAILYKRKRA